MENFNIYIIGCTNGLNTLYRSNDFSYNQEDLKGLDEDERIDSVQFAPSSTFFSCEITENLRVYSLINSKSLDNFGRSGFYAIRLISKNKYSTVSNFRAILEEVEARFIHHKETQTLAQQNYDDILRKAVTENAENIVYFQTKTKYFYPFEEENKGRIDQLLNSNNVYVASKIYAFNGNKIRDEETARALKFEKLEPNIFDQRTITFDRGYLKKITLEGEIMHFGESPLNLIVPKGMIPEAYVGDKKLKGPIRIDKDRTFRRPVAPKPAPKPIQKTTPIEPDKGKASKPLILSVLGLLIVLVIAMLMIGLKIYPFNKEVTVSENEISGSDSTNVENSGKAIEYIMIDSTSSPKKNNKTQYYYTDSINEIKGWRFVPDGEDWLYYKDTNEIKPNGQNFELNMKNIDSFISKTKVDTVKWNQFADKLEFTSKEKVPRSKEKQENTTIEQSNTSGRQNKIPKTKGKEEKDGKRKNDDTKNSKSDSLKGGVKPQSKV